MNRVGGNLALSRAIGDRSYKVPENFGPDKKQVICIPDYKVISIFEGDFLLLACDGIYEGDNFTRETVIKWISKKLEEKDDLAQICADLLDECLKRGSKDNMSAILIQFKDGTDYRLGSEYIPGPYHDGQNNEFFMQAYAEFANEAGYTTEESQRLYNDSTERKKERECCQI